MGKSRRSSRREAGEEGTAEAALPLGGSLLHLLVTSQYTPSLSNAARKAETLFVNLDNLIKKVGLDRVGFVTLTFKENLTDRTEAQRRFNNLASNVLRESVEGWIAAVERQRRGAIHYHLVTVFPYDVRSGFDFEAASRASEAHRAWALTEDAGEKARLQAIKREYEAVYCKSANSNLHAWWKFLREKAEAYGFGRCESLPILSNSQALARYVGSYVSTEIQGRQARDKGLRTIRYSISGFKVKDEKTGDFIRDPKTGEVVKFNYRTASCRWQWATGNGRNWRYGCTVLAAILGTEDFSGVLGDRWGYNWAKEIAAFGRHWELCLAAVRERLSDNNTLDQRIACATKLYEAIAAHENEHKSDENR